jgi:hypothetical protein
MATNKLISYFCNVCGRRTPSSVGADKSFHFTCSVHGDVAAYKSVQYVQDNTRVIESTAKTTKEPAMTMNDDKEALRTYLHGLFYAAEKKNKSKAWMAYQAARRAYKMKSVPLWRGALDALINIGNS